ncbi:MAG: right-handed parallel beta-helix repeat-containing protein [Pseudomonadota bacterium]
MTPSRAKRPLAALLVVAFTLGQTLAAAARDRLAEPGGLTEVLATAQAGDVILLAPGDHGRLDLQGGLPPDLTLAAADPTDRPVIRSLLLRGVAGLTLRDLNLDYDQAARDEPLNRPFQMLDVSNIVLRDLRFLGDRVDEAGGLNLPVSVGLYLENADNIRIEDSVFVDQFRGLVADGATALRIVGNRFHRIRSTGLKLMSVTDTLVEGNEFSGFSPETGTQDAPVMLLVETGQGDRTSAGITVRGNVLSVDGGPWTRSMVFRNHAVRDDAGGLAAYFQDVLIEENVILNAHIDGIVVDEVDGLTIRRNSVLRAAHAADDQSDPPRWTPAVRVAETARGVAVLGNVAHVLPRPTWQDDWVVAGNLLVQDRILSAPNFYDDVFHAVTPSRPPRLTDYAPRPGGPLDGQPLGAPILADIVPEAVIAPAPLRDGPLWRAIWLDSQDGRLKARTGAGRDALSLALTGPDIAVGQDANAVQIDREMTAPIYGAEALRLVLGLQPDASGRRPAGEVLRIHEALLVTLSDRGILEVALQTDSAKWIRVRSRRLPMSPEAPVIVEIRYEAGSGVLSIHDADGAEIGRGWTEGRLKPAESWGLSIGNPFGDRPSFQGRLTEFEVHVRHPRHQAAGFRP